MDRVIDQDGSTLADLVRRIRAADQKAEEELFFRYRRGVTTILRRQGASPDVAEDLFQETLMIVIDKIRRGEVRSPESLSGFICGVAKNSAISHFRKVARDTLVSTMIQVYTSPSPDQDELLVRKQEAEIVHKAINGLRAARDREILMRFYIGEEDRQTICASLGLSSLQFNRILYRAQRRFKELFAKCTAPESILEGKKNEN